MSTDLEVYALAGDEDGGCGFYRIREPARVTNGHGVDITVTTTVPIEATLNQRTGEMKIESLDVHPDVFVIQRPLLRSFVTLIEYAQSQGIACVVEIDDDLKATHPDNIAYPHMNPETSQISNWDNLVHACELADLVTVSTPNLARRYAPHGRYRVLRNCVPEEVFEIDYFRRTFAPRLGWTGTVQTHPEDLEVSGPHINAALQNFGKDKDFFVVGDGHQVKEKLNLASNTNVNATGWVPRGEYIKTMANHFDVGIVPLKIDHFNHSKSWLKMLEMASQGIPAVGSPTEENILLAEITGNKIVNKPKEWQKHLKPLLSNEDYLQERSDAVREAVRHLTYENLGYEWIEAWNAAVDHRAKAGKLFRARA